MSVKSKRRFMAIACMLASLWAAGTATAAVTNAQLEAMLQREKDAREVANVMGVWAAYMATGQLQKTVELIAQQQPDVSVGVNGNALLMGLDAFQKTFAKDSATTSNNLDIHTLSSPIIEVAEDGKTAKGFWQSVGQTITLSRGAPSTALVYEDFAVDFIKEEGQWRVWHMQMFTDLNYDLNKPLDEQLKTMAAPPRTSGPGAAGPGAPPGGPGAGGPPGGQAAGAGGPPAGAPVGPPAGPLYRSWTPTRGPITVQLPRPYKTFSETFSYGVAAPPKRP